MVSSGAAACWFRSASAHSIDSPPPIDFSVPARNFEANPSHHGSGHRRGSGAPAPPDCLHRRQRRPLRAPPLLCRLGLPRAARPAPAPPPPQLAGSSGTGRRGGPVPPAASPSSSTPTDTAPSSSTTLALWSIW